MSNVNAPLAQQLSPEQSQVVETWNQGMAVLAGAGSGKTTTLVTKCAELVKRNPEARFAAVSFTEKSASDLRLKLSQRLEPRLLGDSPLRGHWVMTIHGLCGAILREFPRLAGLDGEESMLSEAESRMYWHRALETLWSDDLQEDLRQALDQLLMRESRESVIELLERVKSLKMMGAIDRLAEQESVDAKSLSRLAQGVIERYERIKRRVGALDFDDLERGADLVLSNDEAREILRKRFSLLVVDEFQDTNPVQARIIQRLARADLSNLCVVGDPKQSIYRFRDADVSVFEDFCSRLPVQIALTWNFRSRPGIIEFANHVCQDAFEASQMRYDALVPKREAHPELDPVIKLTIQRPEDLAAWVQNERARGIELHEMALLLRRIRGNERWLKALTAAGIPLAIGSGGLFWEDPRVRELTAFLKWWDNPGNALSGAVFLRAPWVGIPDATLDQWIHQDKTWVKPFFESQNPLAVALKPWRERASVRPGELLMALLNASDATLSEKLEAELGAPLLGLWHRAEELSADGLDFRAVVSELSRAMEESRRDRDVPPPQNLGQLLVLTLHGSKGLEFPHVILIDFPKKSLKNPNAPLLFWDRVQGAHLSSRDADGERNPKDPVELSWRSLELGKHIAESKRLFYVALTRPRERLILTYLENSENDEADPEKIWSKDFWRGWIDLRSHGYCREVEHQAQADRAAERSQSLSHASPNVLSTRGVQPALKLKRPRHSVTEWNTLSRCERAYEWKWINPVLIAEGERAAPIFTGDPVKSYSDDEITQKELGTRVHACLENADYDGLKRLESEVGSDRFQAEAVISWAMSSPYMAPPQPNGSRRIWTELPFEVRVGSETLVGSMDRLVLDQGSYTVVDFKVTEKLKSVEALLEAYQHQLEIYAHAVEMMDPRAQGQVEAVLVNIAPKTVQVVPVPLKGLSDALAQRVISTATAAAEIVRGDRPARAQAGPLCRFCEFAPRCPEESRERAMGF